MVFISTEMNIILKTIDLNDECLECETGVEYIRAHLNETGRYNIHIVINVVIKFTTRHILQLPHA
jgi:hypothetical protein